MNKAQELYSVAANHQGYLELQEMLYKYAAEGNMAINLSSLVYGKFIDRFKKDGFIVYNGAAQSLSEPAYFVVSWDLSPTKTKPTNS